MGNADGFGSIADNVYKAKLYVEDRVTKAYLETLFSENTASVAILVAGNSKAVKSIVQSERSSSDGRSDRRDRVFGFIDGDAHPSRFADWTVSGTPVIVSTRHEIENFLLDFDALASCCDSICPDLPQQLRRKCRKFADANIWWLACKNTLRHISATTTDDFPKDPTPGKIGSEGEAVSFLCENEWTKTPAKLVSMLEKSSIQNLIREHADNVRAMLKSEEWIDLFPGKELVHCLKSEFLSSAGNDEDIAKTVADYQKKHGRVPEEMSKLIGVILDCIHA